MTDLCRGPELTKDLVRSQPFLLLAVFVVSFGLNMHFERLSQQLIVMGQGAWQAQLGQFFVSILEGFSFLVIGTYHLLNKREATSWEQYFKRFIGPLTAESLRALARIMLWSLAFIIPGLIMYARLIFVQFIVVLDPNYFKNPNAVATALQMTKNCWIRLTLICLSLAVISGCIEFTPHLLKIENFFARAAFDLVSLIFSLFAFIITYLIYENIRTEKGA